jgi:polyferredoxin
MMTKTDRRITDDPVSHPKHYTSGKAHCECGRKIECIDIARHLDFDLGNALKYIWRSEHKNGAEDIKKAIWYLNDYLEKLSTNSVGSPVNK